MTVADRADVEADIAGLRAQYRDDLGWHAATFAMVNAFCWLIDASGTGGINWAPFVTVPWAIFLLLHAVGCLIMVRRLPVHPGLDERLARAH